MIVDKAVYRRGIRHHCGDLSDALDAIKADGEGFLWIGLHDPTPEEFDSVTEELNLHPLAVEDALKGKQRAKIEDYGKSLFVVLKTLRYIESTSDIETGEVMLFVGENFVVTVRRGEANPLASVRRRLEDDPKFIDHGPTAVLYAVMDEVVDSYISIDREIMKDMDEIEATVFDTTRKADPNTIYRLKREVLEFRRAVTPLSESLAAFMEHKKEIGMPTEVGHLFRDIADHLRLVNDHLYGYDRLLTDVLSAHLSTVSVQQNEDMRKISAWVAMAAVPTMIAGIYGMNFEFMPELQASVQLGGHEFYYGYFVVLGVMIAAGIFLYRAFKRSGWL